MRFSKEDKIKMEEQITTRARGLRSMEYIIIYTFEL
jgi:hypothetical protein